MTIQERLLKEITNQHYYAGSFDKGLIDETIVLINLLQTKVSDYAALLDSHMGSPCEQIKHLQEKGELYRNNISLQLQLTRSSQLLGLALAGLAKNYGEDYHPKSLMGEINTFLKTEIKTS